MNLLRVIGLVLALAVPAGAGLARAQTLLPSAPEDEANELSPLTADLWRKVETCQIPDGGYQVDFAGFERTELDIGERQKDLIAVKLRAALADMFRTTPTGRLGTPFDLATLEDLRRAALGDPTVDPGALPPERRAYLLVQARLLASGDGPVLQLQARGFDGCEAPSNPFRLPDALVGEPYVTPERLFEGAGLALWRDRPDGSTAVFVSAEIAGEGAAPDEWTGYFSDLLNAGLAEAPGRIGREVFTSAAPFQVDPRDDRVFDREWHANVRIREVRRGYLVFVDVQRDDRGAIVERGLLNPEDLPERALARLAAAPAIIPGATPVSLGLLPRVVKGEMERGSPAQLLSFSLSVESVVEVEIRDHSGAKPPAVRLRGRTGPDLREPVPVRPGLYRYRLPAGDYAIRILNQNKGRTTFVAAFRAGAGALPPLPPRGSVLLRDFADWSVGTDTELDGTRTCFAYTVADRMVPANWRDQYPVIWFKVAASEAADRFPFDILHYYDQPRYFARGQTPQAVATGTGGVRWVVPVLDVDGRFMSVTERPDGTLLMSGESLEGLSKGLRLVLSGPTAAGAPGQIEYSLVGYQAAINAMLGECGREDLRRKLIRR